MNPEISKLMQHIKEEKDAGKQASLMRELEHQIKLATGEVTEPGETVVDTKLFTGSELLQEQGIYWLAFDIEGPTKSSKGFEGYHTTKGGLFKGSSKEHDTPYGSFKITQILDHGEWKRVKYGPELDAMYNETIGGLFVRITDDFSDFATKMYDLREEAGHRIQVWVQVTVPPKRGTIIRSVHRGKVQYSYRVARMEMVEPIVITSSNDPNWLVCDDSEQLLDTRHVWKGLPYHEGDAVEVTAANTKSIAAAARARTNPQQELSTVREQAASHARREADKPLITRPGNSIEIPIRSSITNANENDIIVDED